MNFEIENCEFNKNFHYDSITEIPYIGSNTPYNDFLKHFMLQNIPCIIKSVTKQWQSSTFWVKSGEPNFEYLRDKYGHSKVTIYNCKERYFNSQKTSESTFRDYLKFFESYKEESDLPLAYLKDWHLKLLNESDDFYNVPIYFASDWLNEYYIACLDDDYRFVYMGTKNTWTPFHSDVFTSYSWSANVCGRKKWLLFPPGQENLLKDNLGNLPYDVSDVKNSVRYFEIIQNPSEAVFVPSGWYHQVRNLENTISVNHNWVNGCNIKKMWKSLQSELKAVRLEIDDCRSMEGFEEHCQVMLNASFGMDFYKFYDFLKYISLSRIEMIENKKSKVMFHGHNIGNNHILFDLRAIRNVLKDFVGCDAVNTLKYFSSIDMKPVFLLEKIINVLENT